MAKKTVKKSVKKKPVKKKRKSSLGVRIEHMYIHLKERVTINGEIFIREETNDQIIWVKDQKLEMILIGEEESDELEEIYYKQMNKILKIQKYFCKK